MGDLHDKVYGCFFGERGRDSGHDFSPPDIHKQVRRAHNILDADSKLWQHSRSMIKMTLLFPAATLRKQITVILFYSHAFVAALISLQQATIPINLFMASCKRCFRAVGVTGDFHTRRPALISSGAK